MASIDKKELIQRWVHSREEDSDAGVVFRPETYDFPLSRRPRDAFELEPDGKLVMGTPSPADSLDQTDGTWELKGNELQFSTGFESAEEPKWQIVSVENDRLVLKKL
jgi:hypothetical protein